jgi:hypothetical protein
MVRQAHHERRRAKTGEILPQNRGNGAEGAEQKVKILTFVEV